MSENTALIVIGADTRELFRGAAPEVLLAVEVEFDHDMERWRATWDDGVQFGETKEEVVINAFRQRLGIE